MNSMPSDKGDRPEYVLVNIVESIVRQKTREHIQTMDMCCCEVCYLNACAIALNSLKQLYVTTHKGALLSRISTVSVGYQAVLTCEVIKALMIVKASPRH